MGALARCLGMLVLVSLSFFETAPGTAEPLTVPLIVEHGVLFMHGNLNGTGPLLFVFDPGADDLVTTYARDRLRGKLPRELNIGGVSIRASLPVLPGDPQLLVPNHDPELGTIAGSLGPALLHRYVIRIDYKRAQIAFVPFKDFSPPPKAAAFPMFIDAFGVPAIRAAAEGYSGSFEIDVRAPVSMLFTPFVKRDGFEGRYAQRPVLKTSQFGNQYALSNFSIGAFTVRDSPTWFSKAAQGKFASDKLAGLLGNAVLSNFTVTFDYATQTIYLER